jgi:hypothetical protein
MKILKKFFYGSGRVPRPSPGSAGTAPLLCLRLFRAIPRTSLLAVLNALRIERATDDMVTHTGQILHAASADHNDRVLLQIMAFARNVGCYFHAARELHAGYLTERRIRLFWRGGIDAGTYSAPLGAIFEGGGFRLIRQLFPA